MSVFMKLLETRRIEVLRWLVGGCLIAEILSYLPQLEYGFGKYALYQEAKSGVLFPWVEKIANGMGVDTLSFLKWCLIGALLVLCKYLLKNNVWWSWLVWGGVIVFNLTGFLPYGFHYYVLMILSILGVAQLLGVKSEAWTYIKVLLALSYLNTAVAKCHEEMWIQGEVIRIYIDHFPFMSAFQPFPQASLILTWLIIGTQLCFPLVLVSLRARRALSLVMIGMHVFIALVLSIYVFSALMIGLNLILFFDSEILDLSAPKRWLRNRYSSV